MYCPTIMVRGKGSKNTKIMKMEFGDSDYKKELVYLTQSAREKTLHRIRQVPDGFMNWRLNNSTMSFAGIVNHLIHVDDIFLNMMKFSEKRFNWVLGSEGSYVEYDKESYESLIKKLEDKQIERGQVINNLSETDMRELIVEEGGDKMTLRRFILHNLIEHEVYHRGQVAAYLKILKGEK